MFIASLPGRAPGGAIEKASDDREHFRLVEQERVMSLVGDDLGERHARAAALSACTIARESDVGNSQSLVNEITQKRVGVSLNAFGQHAVMIGREVEIIHRAREIEIGIGVEALDEGEP